MSEKMVNCFIVFLALVALVEAGILLRSISSDNNRVTFTPLFHELTGGEPGTKDRSFELENPQKVNQVIHRQLGLVGEVLTLEDIVRGVDQLHRNGKINKELTSKLQPKIRRAKELRGELLECQEQTDAAHKKMGSLAEKIVAQLTPKQRSGIISQRDRVAINGMEAPYWDALLRVLEGQARQ